MSDMCMVYFKKGSCQLKTLKELLSPNYKVSKSNNKLIISQDDETSLFTIAYADDGHVQMDAKQLALNSEFADKLQKCDARFEIEIADLTYALDEMNTLMEIQGVVQDASKGYLFLPWNGNVLGPWAG